MEKNDFITDVNVTKKKFSKKMKFLLILAIIFTGMCVISGTANVLKMLEEETWKSKDIRIVAYNLIAYLFIIMIFISMIRIYASRQFFIRSLSKYFFWHRMDIGRSGVYDHTFSNLSDRWFCHYAVRRFCADRWKYAWHRHIVSRVYQSDQRRYTNAERNG